MSNISLAPLTPGALLRGVLGFALLGNPLMLEAQSVTHTLVLKSPSALSLPLQARPPPSLPVAISQDAPNFALGSSLQGRKSSGRAAAMVKGTRCDSSLPKPSRASEGVCVCVCVGGSSYLLASTGIHPRPQTGKFPNPHGARTYPGGCCGPDSSPEGGFGVTRALSSDCLLTPDSLAACNPVFPIGQLWPPRDQSGLPDVSEAQLPPDQCMFLSSRGSPRERIDFWAMESPAPGLRC